MNVDKPIAEWRSCDGVLGWLRPQAVLFLQGWVKSGPSSSKKMLPSDHLE